MGEEEEEVEDEVEREMGRGYLWGKEEEGVSVRKGKVEVKGEKRKSY